MSDSNVANLPHGWASAPLGELASDPKHIAYGVLKPGPRTDDGIPMFRVKDVVGGRIDASDVYRISRSLHSEFRRTELSGGEVLLSIQGSVGRVAVVPHHFAGANVSRTLAVIPPARPELASWIWAMLQTPQLDAQIRKLVGGTTRDSFNLADVRCVVMPVAPLSEQRRIVEALETQFSRLDAAVTTLKRVQVNLKRYRAAILLAAVEGRLEANAGITTWSRRRLGDLGDCVTGTTPPTAKLENYGGDLPFFKPTDLDAGYYVLHARQTLSREGASAARFLPAGSVLVTCIGATIGKTGLARVECATNQQINAFVPSPDAGDPRWFYWSMVSPLAQHQIRENASATTLPILNKSRFAELMLPVPPLDEQRRIVEEIERLFSLIDVTEKLVVANEVRIERLRQSLLRIAFDGRLVPQDPRDEPASVLLDCIRAERAAALFSAKNRAPRSRR